MSAQTQAKTSGDGEQGFKASGKGQTAPSRENTPGGLSNLWAEQSKLWSGNGIGRFAAAMVIPSIDASLSLFNDWRDLLRATADQLEEDAGVVRDGWQELGQCERAEDYAKTGAALRETLTKQCAKSGQKMASLAGEYASRRLRAGTELATSVIDRAKNAVNP